MIEKMNGRDLLYWYYTIMVAAKAKERDTIAPFMEHCGKALDNGTLDKVWDGMSEEDKETVKKFVNRALPDLLVFIDYYKQGLDINDPADRCWYTHGADPYDCYLCHHHSECSCGEDFWNK